MKLALTLTAAIVAPCLLATPALAQSQADLNLRAASEERAADQALNAQYTATMNSLSQGSRTLLRNAQRSWITFRDNQCRYESSAVRGGSAEPMVLNTCRARMTNERTRELRRYGQCPEGDLACPR